MRIEKTLERLLAKEEAIGPLTKLCGDLPIDLRCPGEFERMPGNTRVEDDHVVLVTTTFRCGFMFFHEIAHVLEAPEENLTKPNLGLKPGGIGATKQDVLDEAVVVGRHVGLTRLTGFKDRGEGKFISGAARVFCTLAGGAVKNDQWISMATTEASKRRTLKGSKNEFRRRILKMVGG